MSHEQQCPVCDSAHLIFKRVTLRGYDGLDSVTLKNVMTYRCKNCQEEFEEIPHQVEVTRKIREGLCALRRRLTGAEFAFLRVALDLSGRKAGQIMDVSNVTVSRWENAGGELTSGEADRLARTLTLIDLGYANEVIERLIALEKHGAEDVVIDVSVFAREPADYLSDSATFPWFDNVIPNWKLQVA